MKSSCTLVCRWLVACLLAVFASAGFAKAQPSSCTIGGYFVMVFGGAFLEGRTGELRDSLEKLVGTTIGGQFIVWKSAESDATNLAESLANIAGDLGVDYPELAKPSDEDVSSLLAGKGSGAKAMKLRDVLLPFIGEHLAKSQQSDEGVKAAANNAYQQLAAEIKTGKRVLLVAHSDATLTMQAAYVRLASEFGADKVKRYSIAPIATVPGDAAFISTKGDRVLAAIRSEGGTAPNSSQTSNTESKDILAHDALRVYLDASSGLRDKIKNDITNAIQGATPVSSPTTAGRMAIRVRPSGDFFVGIDHEPPPGVVSLPAAEEKEIRPGIYEHTFIVPCDMQPEQSGTYKFTIWFGSDAKPGDTAQVTVTRDGAGTTQKTIKAPTLKGGSGEDEYDYVDTHAQVPVTSFTVNITANGVSSTDNSPPPGIAAVMSARNPWRESEILVGKDVNKTAVPPYLEQQTFLAGAHKGQIAGVAGSVRPDWYQLQKTKESPPAPPNTPEGAEFAIEVKNYDVRKNRANLLKVLKTQLTQRLSALRTGAKQMVRIDVSGQKVTAAEWNALRAEILALVPGAMSNDPEHPPVDLVPGNKLLVQ